MDYNTVMYSTVMYQLQRISNPRQYVTLAARIRTHRKGGRQMGIQGRGQQTLRNISPKVTRNWKKVIHSTLSCKGVCRPRVNRYLADIYSAIFGTSFCLCFVCELKILNKHLHKHTNIISNNSHTVYFSSLFLTTHYNTHTNS